MLEPTSAAHVLCYITPISVFIFTLREGLTHPYTYMRQNTHMTLGPYAICK